MTKCFLIIIFFPFLLFSSQQIILVVADDFNTSKAQLEYFENNKSIDTFEVNIGRNGLGIGLGEVELSRNENEPIKQEGDGKAPVGVFKLTNIFGYNKSSNFSLPYLYASKTLICVDHSDSNFYNKIIEMDSEEKSFEYMRRDDNQYEIGITVEHNKYAKPYAGSCIFLHVQKDANSPTSGCTSMKLSDIKKIASWLDKNKNPILIQIPRSFKEKVLELYPQLHTSKIL